MVCRNESKQCNDIYYIKDLDQDLDLDPGSNHFWLANDPNNVKKILFYTYTYIDSLNPKGQVSSFKT